MDYHRQSGKQDTRNSRSCSFCQQADPDFSQRRAADQAVLCGHSDSAAAHVTEEGFLRHRMVELRNMAARHGSPIQVHPNVAA